MSLRITRVNKSLGSFRITNLDFTFDSGTAYGLVGPNGAGKTTSLRMMAGLLPPDSGSIIVGDHDLYRQSSQARQDIAFVPDEAISYARLTGNEFVRYVLALWNYDAISMKNEIASAFEAFSLKEIEGNFISTYSRGMKQRLMLLAALLHKPRVLLMDEPFTGLDPSMMELATTKLKQFVVNGGTLILSTHLLPLALELCQHILVVNNGSVVSIIDPSRADAGSLLKQYQTLIRNE